MQPKVGQYYYAPCGRSFRLYRYTSVTTAGSQAEPTCMRFDSREEARRQVYRLNGWNYTPAKPKHARP
ncbi:hypothetical protein [uncultured Muribaculum sp.]|uniref:hypothetical protein n=1 Tax=uncultured Muribaculum sp. TaxID=1918613 RepID=UPI0025B005ED|nr:hypothetical protein [uncultured Muribaculum sp.]